MNYKPFEDRKHLIQCALQNAILYEESRIDAGVCNVDETGNDLKQTKAGIAAYRRYLKQIAPNRSLTLNEQMNEDLKNGKIKLVPLYEFMDTLSKDGKAS